MLACAPRMRSEIGKLASPEKADAECCRQNDCECTNEGSRRCKERMAAGRQPQQHWKQQRNRDDGPPKSLRQKNDESIQDY